MAFFVIVGVTVGGCLSSESALDISKPTASLSKPQPSAAPSSGQPTHSPESTADGIQPRPTDGPTATTDPATVAGPPFPSPDAGVSIYDRADIFTAATEETAAGRIATIEQRQDAQIFVFTQHKPGSSASSTERDARALSVQWGVRNGLLIMWNTTRAECTAGAGANGEVQLYAGARYSTLHLSQDERQNVFDEDMVPFLRECNEDEALLAALDGIEAAGGVAPSPLPSRPPGTGRGACADSAFKLSGHEWDGAYVWRFQESSVPDSYDADEVLEILRRSASNITDVRNDCDLPDNVDATERYAGTTDEEPCLAEFADGVNSVGFAELPEDTTADTVAIVCTYGSETDVVEADILISWDIPWALSEEDCVGDQELLEATVTHEFGHVFGLGHVSESSHGDLTMSPMSNGPCDSEEISLGLGDILGLEELY